MWSPPARAGPGTRSPPWSRGSGSTVAARATPRPRSPRCSALLGTWRTTAPPLRRGGRASGTRPEGRPVLDIRSPPGWDHRELTETLRARLTCELQITSDRLVPCETPPESRLLAAARRVRPALRTFGSPTCSDWVFLRHTDAFKCGPGTSRRSHTPDEWVDLTEVREARRFYA